MLQTTGPAGLACIALLIAALAGCQRERPLEPTFQSVQTHVFDVHCAVAACHRGPNPESLLNLERRNAYENLVDVNSVGIPGRLRVDPGNPDQSYLLHKLRGESIVGERMPSGRTPLPDSLIEAVESWIAAGAPRG